MARHYALQALYQWHVAATDPRDIEAEFRADNDFDKVDGEYFHDLLRNVAARAADLEAAFAPHLVGRAVGELDAIERALLRIGAYELLERADVPVKVALNEAVGLAKTFGATDSHKFVNAVLDQLARQCRGAEMGHG